MKTITILDSDDNDIELPAKYEVCSRCRGEGKHTNPNIDGNGITASEWERMTDDDPDFPENYLSGMYDVQCKKCNGRTTELVVDEDYLSPDQKKQYDEYCERMAEAARDDAEDRKYRRMEDGDY